MARMWHDFDEVYSVSDLHLGGVDKEGQIFDQGDLLAKTIRTLSENAGKRRVALVLNGDIVDFLAEREPMYLDPVRACERCERIINDPSFMMVWEALGEFVRQAHSRLVLVLGNHDLELALPAVRELILKNLGGASNPAVRGRVEFSLDGAGYRCTILQKTVFFVHGNDVDDWNWVDHKSLRDVAFALNCAASIPTWRPNAGTKLVIDVMNQVKRQWPFVDLLKPEKLPLALVLLAVDPAVKRKLVDVLKIMPDKWLISARRRAGWLSDEQTPGYDQETDDMALGAWLNEQLHAANETPISDDIDDLLLKTERRFQRGDRVLMERGKAGRTLGRPSEQVKAATISTLRHVLRYLLRDERTFAYDGPDEVFDALDKIVGQDVDYLVAGHTHLARVRKRYGGGVYFNTGTWARLIELTDDLLDTDEHFTEVFAALKAGRMSALDLCPGLIRREPTVVCLKVDAGQVQANLCNAVERHGEVVLKPV